MALIFTLIWFPLIGLAASRLVGRMNAFLAGAGLNGLVLFVAGVLHIPLLPVLGVLGVASLTVVVAVRHPERSEGSQNAPILPFGDPSPSSRLRMTDRAADFVLGIAIVFLLAVSAIAPISDFDGRAFWLLKAKAIAHELRVDGPFFRGESTYSPRNEYPLLVPLDAATVMIASRDSDDRAVRWLYAMFAIALALEVRRRAGPWYGALVLWLPQILVGTEGGALTAYCDIALGAFVACAVFELAGEDADPLRFGLWLSFIALTKNEGLPFAAVLLAIGAIVFRLRTWIAAVPTAAAIASLLLWRSRIQPTDDNRYFVERLQTGLHRAGDAIVAFARHVVAFREWGVFWIAVAIAIAVLAWRREWRPLLIGALAILPMMAIYLIMYVASDWKTADLVNATAPRLLVHFIGPALLLIAYANRQNDRRNA